MTALTLHRVSVSLGGACVLDGFSCAVELGEWVAVIGPNGAGKTTALDLGRQQQVLELVDGLRAKRGLTVVSTMHDLTLAGQYADRLLLVNGGRLVAAGSPDDVLTRTLITEHYGAEVAVVDAPGSGFVVVPVRRTP